MYLIPIAWLYVALMMGIAEANHSNGTVLGGLLTFVLYGLGPVALVLYLMGSPARRRAIKAREAAELAAYQAQQKQPPNSEAAQAALLGLTQPDAGSHTPRDAAPPVGEKP
jgi:hypothetical protein